MTSKQEKAKQEQGYKKKPNQCSNCIYFEFEIEKHKNDYGFFDMQKKLRCGKGRFAVKKTAVCSFWIRNNG